MTVPQKPSNTGTPAAFPSAEVSKGPGSGRGKARAKDPSDLEDLAWVEATLAGQSSGFENIFRKYQQRIYGVLYGILRNREDALEGAQEVFVKVYRALERFDPQARFYTWLHRIAVNHGIDQTRRRKTRKEQLIADEPLLPPASETSQSPTGETQRREIVDRLEEALASLSEEHRSVFLLYSYEGLAYAEIAEIVDVPVGTVMSRLFYARKKLKERLPQEWDPGGRKRRDRRESGNKSESDES
ncbi:MAG: sigma-70 family RNA polymerase sigma factor [Planctomycetota bacterium]